MARMPAPRTSQKGGSRMSARERKSFDGGRYQLKGSLGSGLFADVFDAFDTETERRVALKVVRTGPLDPAVVREAFEREVAALEGVEHEAIVRLERWFIEGDASVMVLERVPDGRTLADLLHEAAHGAVRPLAWRLAQALQLARALDLAHARGVVHRDLKPENLLFEPHTETLK